MCYSILFSALNLTLVKFLNISIIYRVQRKIHLTQDFSILENNYLEVSNKIQRDSNLDINLINNI